MKHKLSISIKCVFSKGYLSYIFSCKITEYMYVNSHSYCKSSSSHFDGLFCVFISSMNDDDDVAEWSNLTELMRWHSGKILVLRLILPKVFDTMKL